MMCVFAYHSHTIRIPFAYLDTQQYLRKSSFLMYVSLLWFSFRVWNTAGRMCVYTCPTTQQYVRKSSFLMYMSFLWVSFSMCDTAGTTCVYTCPNTQQYVHTSSFLICICLFCGSLFSYVQYSRCNVCIYMPKHAIIPTPELFSCVCVCVSSVGLFLCL